MNLIYVADPMCSWCYGFGKTMDALLSQPDSKAAHPLALVMGGLRPYTTEPLAAGRVDEIQEHWRHVREATALPFAQAPNTALHLPGFIYDTEPASRATVTVRTLWPQHTWHYFKSVQAAFYAQARDVTQPQVLSDVAREVGLPHGEFAAAFDSNAMREATRADFLRCEQWGIRGFPALLAERGGELHIVCHGYAPIEDLLDRLDALA